MVVVASVNNHLIIFLHTLHLI